MFDFDQISHVFLSIKPFHQFCSQSTFHVLNSSGWVDGVFTLSHTSQLAHLFPLTPPPPHPFPELAIHVPSPVVNTAAHVTPHEAQAATPVGIHKTMAGSGPSNAIQAQDAVTVVVVAQAPAVAVATVVHAT